jgi:hypothetical protein
LRFQRIPEDSPILNGKDGVAEDPGSTKYQGAELPLDLVVVVWGAGDACVKIWLTQADKMSNITMTAAAHGRLGADRCRLEREIIPLPPPALYLS